MAPPAFGMGLGAPASQRASPMPSMTGLDSLENFKGRSISPNLLLSANSANYSGNYQIYNNMQPKSLP